MNRRDSMVRYFCRCSRLTLWSDTSVTVMTTSVVSSRSLSEGRTATCAYRIQFPMISLCVVIRADALQVHRPVLRWKSTFQPVTLDIVDELNALLDRQPFGWAVVFQLIKYHCYNVGQSNGIYRGSCCLLTNCLVTELV